MGDSAVIADDLKARIIQQPDVILEDIDLMRALVAANDRALGDNVVDLRGIAMDRLAARLDQLEDTHRSVIAAAYENLAGTNQIHRAVLRLLDAPTFEGFLEALTGDVAAILRTEALRLVIETQDDDPDMTAVQQLDGVLVVAGRGFAADYAGDRTGQLRPVTLRQLDGGPVTLYGRQGAQLRSEACLALDFGEKRLPGLLLLGSTDAQQFAPTQGTDLLGFFGGVFERSMRRWLS